MAGGLCHIYPSVTQTAGVHPFMSLHRLPRTTTLAVCVSSPHKPVFSTGNSFVSRPVPRVSTVSYVSVYRLQPNRVFKHHRTIMIDDHCLLGRMGNTCRGPKSSRDPRVPSFRQTWVGHSNGQTTSVWPRTLSLS